MTLPTLLPLLLTSLLAAQPEGELSDTAPARTQTTERNRMLDISADAMNPGEREWHVLGKYARGFFFPGFQLSTELAADTVSILNLTAKWQFLRLPEASAAVQVGGYWSPLVPLLSRGSNIFYVPAELRLTVPLVRTWEINVAGSFLYNSVDLATSATTGVSQKGIIVGSEMTLVRYDSKGAWYLQGKLPLLSTDSQTVRLEGSTLPRVGSVTRDDISAWSLLVGRDLTFSDQAHLRLGVGYRNQPGIFLVQSFGKVIATVDLYWR
ncbi:MAG: hypothetical protein ACT4TC_20750 [Myxococcaceae bacterium]